MKQNFLSNFKKVYFVGIGGVSMSALAKFLHTNGFIVSGSDLNKSNLTTQLEELGIKVYYSHGIENVLAVDLVVYTSAISVKNPELCYARENGIPTITRSELLNEALSNYKKSVAVAGSHGKTTTTAMIMDVLSISGNDPTVFLGGEYGEVGNFRLGNSDYAVCEACEYKKAILDISPKISVVLNIDNDHLECYYGMEDMVESFKRFVGDKLAVINADDKYADYLSNQTTVTFGIYKSANYYATNVVANKQGTSFTACANSRRYGRINMKLMGEHNVYNALCAFAVCDLMGVSFSVIKKALEEFKGVKRRLEFLGKVNGVECYADYAHHPKEIKATLSAFSLKGEGFLVVFQPHTYSRTKLLLDEFVDAFKDYKNLIIYKTFPARESYDRFGSARVLYKRLINEQVQKLSYAQGYNQLVEGIKKQSEGIKRIIFLGAGDIYSLAEKYSLKNGKK